MSERATVDHNDNEARQRVTVEEDALRSAIAHIRNAKGVLDSFPPTHKYVKKVEALADDLDNKRRPLSAQLQRWRNEYRDIQV